MSLAVPAPAAWLSRFEAFDFVGSTNDAVGGWLREGAPEVCIAIADVQAAGRGRNGRSWAQPSGAGLLLSAGFRPSWLEIGHLWRLAATVSMAMAEAGEAAAGLQAGTIRLKWPNDLVSIDRSTGDVRKLGGTLGETDGVGTADPKAVIGIGLNVDWSRDQFPPDLASSMTSLSELAAGGPVDREAVLPSSRSFDHEAVLAPARSVDHEAVLAPARSVDREAVLEGFLERLEVGVAALRLGKFPSEAWRRRQVTNGRIVTLDQLDGTTEIVLAEDVDAESGALLVRELVQRVAVGGSGQISRRSIGEMRGREPGPERGHGAPRSVVVGEIRHVRVGGTV